MYSELIDDPKIKELNDREFKIWVFLLCLACDCDANGYLKDYDFEKLSWRFRMKPKQLQSTINKLIELNMVSIDNNIFYITHWKLRQYMSDDVAKRVQKHRDVKRYSETLHTEGDVTYQNRTDTEQIQNIPEPEEVKKTVAGMVDKILLKSKLSQKDQNIFIDLLKRIGIPGFTAVQYTQRYGLDYIARKIVQLEYTKTTDTKVDNEIGYLKTLIEYDKFPVSEGYYEYAKSRAEKLLKSDDYQMRVLGAYL